MVGIIVGVTTLTLIFSLGKGTEKKIMDNIKRMFSASNIIIQTGGGRFIGRPGSDKMITTLTVQDLDVLQSEIPNIELYDPVQMLDNREARYKENSSNVRVLGHSPASELIWNRTVTSGTYMTDDDMERATRVAMLGVTVVKDIFGDIDPLNKQIRIGNVPFRVIGILEEIGSDPHGINKDNEILIPITTMMKRLMNVDYIMMAKIQVKDNRKMAETVEMITQILRRQHHLTPQEPDDFTMISPIQVQEMISTANRVFNLFLPLIAGVALIVGGVVITNLMLITVNERKSEIGLRKAVGARSKDILHQFLMETTVITISGGFIGILIGAVAVQSFALMLKLPPIISGKAIILGIFFSALVGLGAGVFPALRATKFDPIETLR